MACRDRVRWLSMNSRVAAGDRRTLAAEIEKRIGAENKYTPKGRVSFRNLRLKTAEEIREDTDEADAATEAELPF